MEKGAEEQMKKLRPDLIGSIRAIYGNNEYTDVAYFTSEAEARANEAKPLPDEAMAMFNEWQQLQIVDRYYDLKKPLFYTS